MAAPTHQDQLSAYLDGELEPDEVARLEAELRANPSLRSELDELREVSSFLRTRAPTRAPAGFHARVMAAVEAEKPAAPWWAWLRRPFGVPIEGLAVVAAAAAVLLLAIPEDPDQVDPGQVEAAREEAAGMADAAPPDLEKGVEKGVEKGAEDDGVAVVDDLPEAPPKGAREEPGAKEEQKAAPVEPIQRAIAPPKQEATPDQATTDQATTDQATTVGGSAGNEAGTADASAPVGRTAGYRYEVYADDPGVLGELQRIAGRYEGAVRDLAGATVSGTRQASDEAVYAIRIPASSLQSFHREIQRIGVRVTPAGDNRIFGDAFVDVAVTVRLTGGPPAARPSANEADQRP